MCLFCKSAIVDQKRAVMIYYYELYCENACSDKIFIASPLAYITLAPDNEIQLTFEI